MISVQELHQQQEKDEKPFTEFLNYLRNVDLNQAPKRASVIPFCKTEGLLKYLEEHIKRANHKKGINSLNDTLSNLLRHIPASDGRGNAYCQYNKMLRKSKQVSYQEQVAKSVVSNLKHTLVPLGFRCELQRPVKWLFETEVWITW